MSYTPTTWTTGDTVTAAAMNKIEQGIAGAGGALICNSSYDNGEGAFILDKTAQEIYDAILAGTPVYIKYQYGDFESYQGTLYLAPVIKIYNYDYAAYIRICASKPQYVGSDYTFTPAILIYQAGGADEYPTFSKTVYVPQANVSTIGDVE